MEKMIKLSKNSWHYRIIKYTFGINGDVFTNLCPYFWLFIASLFIIPFKFFYNKAIKPIYLAYSERLDRLSVMAYNDSLRRLGEEKIDVFYNVISNSKYWYDDVNLKKIIPRSIISKSRAIGIEKVYEDWINANGKTFTKPEYDVDKLEEYLSRMNLFKGDFIEKNESYKKKAIGISNKSKRIAALAINLIGVILFYFIFFCVSVWIILILSSFIQVCINSATSFKITVSVLAVLALAIVCKDYIRIVIPSVSSWITGKGEGTSANMIEKTIFFIPSLIYLALYYALYEFLYKNVVKSFVIGCRTIILESIGLFGEYIKSSYSDYCPGIEWDDDEANNDKLTN